MLSYAFQTLRQNGYKDVEAEEFTNTADLFADILAKGIAVQIKRGLGMEYKEKVEQLSRPVGKMLISQSIGLLALKRTSIYCSFDEFTENNMLNSVLKSTALMLVRSDFVNEKRKISLRHVLKYFTTVDCVNLNSFNWHSIKYNRGNATYEMLVNICMLACTGLIQSQIQGSTSILDFIDDQYLHRLYEKFILEYYRKHYYPEVSANPCEIEWSKIDCPEQDITFLPNMRTDVLIEAAGYNLIIDAKFYGQSMQYYRESSTLHSNNLYQIYAYVKNLDKNNNGKVSGMLLYAKTDDALQPKACFNSNGNMIYVDTLDLSIDFNSIKKTLDRILTNWLASTSGRTIAKHD